MFPFTSSPELARQAVAACRYPTLGRRGSGAEFAQFRWPAPGSYYDFADKNVLVTTIIEDLPGLEQIDEIAATPGIDVIFIGTSDLSFALGLRGRQDEPRLAKAIAKIVAAAKKNGKFLGRPAGTLDQIRKCQKQGFRFFQTRTDTDLVAAGAEQLLKPLGRKRQFAANAAI
jgi:2-keto-3-deoxy-L-rhamnonate aldolase RhmA